jgi:hypothetical protein
VIKGRNLVVLIDTSASMKANDTSIAGSKPRIDLAREEVRKLVRGLGASDRMLLAEMDATVTPLTAMIGDIGQLEQSLDKVQPCDCRADLSRALRFATDTLRGMKEPEIVVVSDGNLGEARDGLGLVKLGDVKLSYINVGSGRRNVAITQFSVRRYPLDKARYEVMLEVQNLGDHDENLELSLYGDGDDAAHLVDLSKLHLKAGEKLPRFYPNLGGASRTLMAKVALAPANPGESAAHDDLAADDVAYAVLPERRRVKVLSVTSGNTYLEAALLLDEYLDVTTVTPDQMQSALEKDRFDVAIFDGITPPLKPGLPSIYLDPHDQTGPIKIGAAIDEPGFDTLERKHPILRWTALDNVQIAKGVKLIPGEGDKVVGASDTGPILVAGARSGTRFVMLGFDVRQSDFPLRIAWPVFLLNSINWFVEEDADYLSSFRTGEVWHVPAPLGVGDHATLVDPDGTKHEVPVQEGRAVFFGTRAGFHRVLADRSKTPQPGEAPRVDTVFAANLVDPIESAIAPRPELIVDGKKGTAVAGFTVGVRREIWIYLLIAAVIIAAIEWATYHRRITV